MIAWGTKAILPSSLCNHPSVTSQARNIIKLIGNQKNPSDFIELEGFLMLVCLFITLLNSEFWDNIFSEIKK